MEHQLWKAIVALLRGLDKPVAPAALAFSDEGVVAVYYRAVLHGRPTSWACLRRNWPIRLRHRPPPSQPTMSRRLRSPRSWPCSTPWSGG
jgi:hypothetical protein